MCADFELLLAPARHGDILKTLQWQLKSVVVITFCSKAFLYHEWEDPGFSFLHCSIYFFWIVIHSVQLLVGHFNTFVVSVITISNYYMHC